VFLCFSTWSSFPAPTRRVRGRDLTTIPNELYFKIFSYLTPTDEGLSESESKRIYSRLAKVCRLFCAELLPRIFASMEFTFPLLDASEWPKSLIFCNELNANKQPAFSLVSYIKACSFIASEEAEERSLRVCLGIYSRSLSRLVYLESLSFTSIPINNKIFQALGGLKSLTKLFIRNCSFDSELTEIRATIQPLSLTHFELFETTDVPDAFIPIVLCPSLQVLKVDDRDFASSVVRQTIEWSLKEFSVSLSMDDYPLLGVFLNSNPSIQTLSVSHFGNIRNSLTATLSLQPTSLPHLESVQCPPFLLLELIPGRPVNSIRISTPERLADDLDPYVQDILGQLAALKRSTAVVKTLQMPWSIAGAKVFKFFPDLRALVLHELHLEPRYVGYFFVSLYCTEEKISQVMELSSDKFSAMPFLRELTWTFGLSKRRWGFDLQDQHAIITEFIKPGTAIRHVQFTEEVYWHLTDHWQPVVPLCMREDVRERLKTLKKPDAQNLPYCMRSNVTDFDGLLASFFQPDELPDCLKP
jgi:hypothetical protein